VVGKAGTAVVERAEIVHEIEQQSALAVSDKVMRLEQVREQVQMWRRMGLKPGFISGSFKQLSPQNLAALEQARAGCDRLVVVVKSDSTLQREGLSTPPDQSARAYLLASTVFSDAVVIDNDGAPEQFLDAGQDAWVLSAN
jgi:D-beta-D-heptose 7-phosphate kinase/D-beta-D-heptose 1-phosphate adenosyltransferase